MARAPKRLIPKYVHYEHGGTEYVIDLANREVMLDWVCIERQAMPNILAACAASREELASA